MGKLKNMIVVMQSGQVAGVPTRIMQPPGVDGDPPSKDFLEDLISFARRTYPVLNRIEDTAIAGFSMGSCRHSNLALFHSEMFGYVCPMSRGYFPAGIKQLEQNNSDILKYVANHPFEQFIIGRGKDDQLTVANSTATLQMQGDSRIPHKYIELDGVHSFVSARRFLLQVFPLMVR